MLFRAPTTLKLISYRYSNQILKNFLDLRVISEKSAPEIASLEARWVSFVTINHYTFARDLAQIQPKSWPKTRFWAQGGRNLFPAAHIRSAESTNVLYDASKDELHTTSGTLSSVHRKIAGRSPDPCFRDTNVHWVMTGMTSVSRWSGSAQTRKSMYLEN